MAAEKGSQYWKRRLKHGKNPNYNPEELEAKAIEYFQWVEDNPLYEEKIFSYQGVTNVGKVEKQRAMTLVAFRLFADISHTTWDNYVAKDNYIAIITHIKDIIYTQKLEGAASDLFNANIIARELGMTDKTATEHTGEVNTVVTVNYK
jgi:hypothetical protein